MPPRTKPRGFHLTPDDLERARAAAHRTGLSLNAFVVAAIRAAIDAPPGPAASADPALLQRISDVLSRLEQRMAPAATRAPQAPPHLDGLADLQLS